MRSRGRDSRRRGTQSTFSLSCFYGWLPNFSRSKQAFFILSVGFFPGGTWRGWRRSGRRAQGWRYGGAPALHLRGLRLLARPRGPPVGRASPVRGSSQRGAPSACLPGPHSGGGSKRTALHRHRAGGRDQHRWPLRRSSAPSGPKNKKARKLEAANHATKREFKNDVCCSKCLSHF